MNNQDLPPNINFHYNKRSNTKNLLKDIQMLSESMLQKFTTKIQKLVNSNQTSQRLESPNKQITGSMDKFNSLKKIISDSKKKFKTEFNSNVIDIDQQSDSGVPKNIQIDAASDQNPNGHNSEDFGQNQLNQKINIKEVTKIINHQKPKTQVATRLNTGSSTIKKTVQSASFQKQIPSTVQNLKTIVNPPATKPTFQMPKVSVMNNLIKLSIKLNSNEILKQIKYQATLISLAPIRLLLYFCIEKMLYIMYETHGVDKMQQKSKDSAFIQKQIQISLISLLKYLKISQRTMISRILRGVFNRLGIGANFSQKWLTDCLKTNKNAIEALNIDVNQIMKPPLLNNITSNIFIGITNPQKRANLNQNHPNLELQDQNSTKQRIQDPEISHNQQSLFFFKKYFSKFRQNMQKSNQNNKNGVKNEIKKDTNIEQTDNYELKSFRVQLKNIKLPQNIKILTNPQNFDEFDIYKPIDPQNNEVSDSEIAPRRRGRSQMNRNIVQQRKQMQRQPSERTPITKQQIIQIIQQYFNGNIEQIGNKIAKKWQIDPKQLKNLIKQTAIGKSMPSKIKSEPINVKSRPQTDAQIIKQIQNKSNQLQKAAVSHKQLVKQIFKLLQSKDLTHEKKQEIMDKWIALKKQKKMERK